MTNKLVKSKTNITVIKIYIKHKEE